MKRKPQRARMTPTQLEERVLSLRLSDGVGFLVRIIDTRVRTLYEELTRQNDVTPRQFGTLLTLYQRGTLTLTELATSISVDRSTLSEMIGRMVRKRLISKAANGDDARSA
jgi:DNA-binding MarR family transcriptional regulator